MKRVFLGLLLLILLYNVSACAGKEADTETRQMAEDKSVSSDQNTIMAIEDNAEETEKQETEVTDTGVFNFETKTVLLNSGYEMPIMGLGTYSLDYDTCVSSVKTLLKNGGRLIDTAYMYGNEDWISG